MSYKKRELRVYKNGFCDLAKAVVRQWNTDGRPRSDEECAKAWGSILKEHHKNIGGAVRHGKIVK